MGILFSMSPSSEIRDITFLPWQSTVMAGISGVALVLFCLSFVIAFLFSISKKKKTEDALNSIGCYVFGAFVFTVMIFSCLAVGFLVGTKLDWKYSIITGVSAVITAIFLMVMVWGAFTKMSMRRFVTLMCLSMISFASVVGFVMKSLETNN